MKNVKGIVLAGGTGSRLYPLTKVTNKHLLPVGKEPMIFHPIKKLIEAGIKEVMVVTGTEHMGDVVGLLGSGKDYDAEFTYRVQDQAGGIAQALGLARSFVGNDRCVVILGDNIFETSLTPALTRYREQASGAHLLLKEVHDPQRYGVATVSGKLITKIVEKPTHPESNYAVTGVYMYDADVFSFINHLKPSGRGELEITDVNSAYLGRGDLTWSLMDGFWTDAGTFESWKHANDLVLGITP
ncbi:MAG: NTP transferase domain-containing protein [Deltaproteobacteria bacterium]|nr:NTP transferase domain-containing protein [Deltaproteobacteria bacterium]